MLRCRIDRLNRENDVVLFLTKRDIVPLIDPVEAIEVLERSFLRWDEPPAFSLERRRMWGRNQREVYVLGGVTPGGDVLAARMSARDLANYIMLFSEQEKGLAAIIEHFPIGQARTGAATGLATKYLAREDAHSIGIVGTGGMAPMQLRCICAVRAIERVKAFSRRPERLAAFAEQMTKELGVPVEAAQSVEAAVRDVDIVVTLTQAVEPILSAGWLAAGVHINAVGANEIRRRELDDATILGSDIIVIDERAQGELEARALVELVASGKLAWKDVFQLSELVAASGPRRSSKAQRTLFYSLGIGFEDAVYSEHILHKAKAAGVGSRLDNQ